MLPAITGEIRPKSARLSALSLVAFLFKRGLSVVDKTRQVFRAFQIKSQSYQCRKEVLVKEFHLPKPQADKLLGESRANLTLNVLFKLAGIPDAVLAVVFPDGADFCYAAEARNGETFDSEEDAETWVNGLGDGSKWLILGQEPILSV